MPGKAAMISVSERQEVVLRILRDAVTVPSHLRMRATIILMAFAGMRNDKIAEFLDLDQRQVGLWRRRWVKEWNKLTELECRETKAELRRAIETLLSDRPRSGSPGKFTPEQVVLILAVACEPPENSGWPITHWTAKELAEEVVNRGIVDSISVTQVGRYLREAAMQPHKSEYWLNTTEKDPVEFQKQVEAVCDAYLQAPILEQTKNTHTVCVDEMTGIQALERTAASKPLTTGIPERIEFEYKRHGTLTLIGNFEVTTGELLSPTISPTRTEIDFSNHIEQTIAADPGASWIFITDNLNIHCSETLTQLVAKACEITTDLGKKGKEGVLKSVATRQEFLSDPKHQIRFVYTPKHSSWLNQIETVFGIIKRKVLRRGSFTSTEHLSKKLSDFIEYFNRAFAQPFRWTYTGRPLMQKLAA